MVWVPLRDGWGSRIGTGGVPLWDWSRSGTSPATGLLCAVSDLESGSEFSISRSML